MRKGRGVAFAVHVEPAASVLTQTHAHTRAHTHACTCPHTHTHMHTDLIPSAVKIQSQLGELGLQQVVQLLHQLL